MEYKGDRQAMYNRMEKVAKRYRFGDAQAYAYDCIYGLLDNQALPDAKSSQVLGRTSREAFRRETNIRSRMLAEFLRHD